MAGRLRVFQINLPTIGALSAWRDFDEQSVPFTLEASVTDVFWSMTVDDAVRLGRCADVISCRFRGAAARGENVKVGPVFTRKGDAGELIIEIGIVDDDAIYLRFFDLPEVTLHGEQSRALLAALRCVGDDARTCGGGDALGLAQ
jgi:hypothetical protein